MDTKEMWAARVAAGLCAMCGEERQANQVRYCRRCERDLYEEGEE